MNVGEVVRTIAAVVATGGVVVAALAFRHTREQARTTFEDSLSREYREIVGALPASVFFDRTISQLDDVQTQAMMRYFDLSNEQLRLIGEGRIRPPTRVVWESGIQYLMARRAFWDAWTELSRDLPLDFFELLSEFLVDAPQRVDAPPRKLG